MQLRPRIQPIEAAIDEYRSGRLAACVAALNSHKTPAAHALRARALIRLGKPSDAAADIDSVFDRFGGLIPAVQELNVVLLAELLMLRATALVRLRRFSETEEAFMNARAYAYSAASAPLEAEFVYYEAHYAHAVNAFDKFEAFARAVLGVRPFGFIENATTYFVPLEHSRARAYDLLGFIAGKSHDFPLQATQLQLSLAEFDKVTVRDAWFEATQLSHLSYYTRDFGDKAVANYVRQRFERTEWIAELAPQRHEVLRSLGWSSAMQGDYLSAFRSLRDAADVAPTLPYKIAAILDRAYLSRELHEGVVAREEVDYAERLAERVNWHDVRGESEIAALLHLSDALAPISTSRARRLLERYLMLKNRLPTSCLAHGDPRVLAEETFANAAILRAEGNVDRARLLFVEAFKAWRTVGCGWRAALIARELAALGAGEYFSACVAEEAALRPESWLATTWPA